MTKKLLVVDDEPELLLLLEVRLKAAGFEVLKALDGESGLAMAQTERPDLIILDVMLPKMDGFKVCALLKRDARYAKTPIILFTARAQEEDKAVGEEAGADAYVTKPFNPPALLSKIQDLLGKAAEKAG